MKKLKKEIDIVAKALREDKELFFTWQSNIAMAFFDEARRNKLYSSKLHSISNTAAINFLDMLIRGDV